MQNRLTGIILAGGKSTRMGMEKGLISFRGQPLIQHTADVLGHFCHEILISTNSNSYHHLGFKTVPDIQSDTGPMGGIFSCLMQTQDDLNLVISCDMPFVTPVIFEDLLEAIEDAFICVPWHENEHFEPLCGIYRKESIREMKRFIEAGNFKLPDLYKQVKFKQVEIRSLDPPLHDYYFLSINTPNDLELANRLVAGNVTDPL